MLKILSMGLIIFGFIIPNAQAKGLKVAPASYTWRNVKAGIIQECPAKILVKNESGAVKSYTLRVANSEELKTVLSSGFNALPSKRWVSFEPKQIVVAPGKWYEVKIFIEIPSKKMYAHQKWEFFIEVKENTTGTEVFGLACYPKIRVDTGKRN